MRLQLVANIANGTFCHSDCKKAVKKARDSQPFENARDALAAGFRPCKLCTPLKTGIADPAWLVPLMSEVEADPARRWHDHDLDSMAMDSGIVRRWFVANHGMTFHAYTRLRRLGLALRQIQHGDAVSEAVVASGFDSEASFRDAFAQVFGNPPSAVDRESSIWINRIATPLGSMIVGVHDSGLCLLEFAERRMLDTQLKRLQQRMGRVFLPGDHPLMKQVKQELDAYFEGSLRKFTVPLQAPGTTTPMPCARWAAPTATTASPSLSPATGWSAPTANSPATAAACGAKNTCWRWSRHRPFIYPDKCSRRTRATGPPTRRPSMPPTAWSGAANKGYSSKSMSRVLMPLLVPCSPSRSFQM
jgi:AraC family transcriptional regulator of adaptative response/methylated-DNA-[protein]-cysteine methyltransferase